MQKRFFSLEDLKNYVKLNVQNILYLVRNTNNPVIYDCVYGSFSKHLVNNKTGKYYAVDIYMYYIYFLCVYTYMLNYQLF